MKLKVLFVDSDESLIAGLEKVMHSVHNEWDLSYANKGKKALELLEQSKIDIIISDIQIPDMDGTQLLKIVKEKYPQIVRVTLSSYSNDNLALRNTRVVHQSLSKPATPHKILTTIENIYRLRKKLKNEELLSIVNGIDDLPSLPELYIKLEEEIKSPNSSIDKLSKIISTDPIIAAKILQLTSSAFFGLPNRISNITQALNFLGIELVKYLVLSIKLFRSFSPNSPHAKIYEDIWTHSNKVALMAQHLAKSQKLPRVDIEDSYLGGLLHDIGKLILLEKIKGINISNDLKFTEYENQFSNATHADIGAYLLGIWALPLSIVESVAFHHSYEPIIESELTPATMVSVANYIVHNSSLTPPELDNENVEKLFNDYQLLQLEKDN